MSSPSPEQAAQIITVGILQALQKPDQDQKPSEEELDVRLDQLILLSRRGRQILVQQGYQREMQEGSNRITEHYDQLFMRTLVTRYTDIRGEEAGARIRKTAETFAEGSLDGPLPSQDIRDLAERIREPYNSLFVAVISVNRLAAMAQYSRLRDMGNDLLGFRNPNQQPPQS